MPNLSPIERTELIYKIQNLFKIFYNTETAKLIHQSDKDTPTLGKLWENEQENNKYFKDYIASEYILFSARKVIYDYMVRNKQNENCEDIKLLKNQFNDLDTMYQIKLEQDKLNLELEKLKLENLKLSEERSKTRAYQEIGTALASAAKTAVSLNNNYVAISESKDHHKDKNKLFKL